MARRILPLALITSLVLAIAPSALAGKSSISLVANPNPPSFGQHVTFSVSTTQTANPWVDAQCYQNGRIVYEESHAFWNDPYDPSKTFTLGPTAMWPGGAASCVAYLVSFSNGHWRRLASTSFNVSA